MAAPHQLTMDSEVVLAVCETKNNGHPTYKADADTDGWSKATFVLGIGTTDVTVDAAMYESDDDSTYTLITSSEITQVADSGDNRVVAIEVDLTTGVRKRYLRPSVTCGNSTTGAALAGIFIMTRGNASPANAAGAGLAERVSV